MNGTFHFLADSPYGGQSWSPSLSEYFFKGADKMLNFSDDSKKLSFRNPVFHRGVWIKIGMSQCDHGLPWVAMVTQHGLKLHAKITNAVANLVTCQF